MMAEHIQPKGREKCGLQTQQGLDADVVPSPCRGMNMAVVMRSLLATVETIAVEMLSLLPIVETIAVAMLSLLLTVETIAVVALDDDHAVALDDLAGGRGGSGGGDGGRDARRGGDLDEY